VLPARFALELALLVFLGDIERGFRAFLARGVGYGVHVDYHVAVVHFN